MLGYRALVATDTDAGHFAFWGPAPAQLASPHFPPSVDPPGFDRATYQARLLDELLTFLA